jgi:hypothetical protein
VALLARPGLVPPGEEDDAELGEDVGVGDVEVVFEGADGDVFADLDDVSNPYLCIYHVKYSKVVGDVRSGQCTAGRH